MKNITETRRFIFLRNSMMVLHRWLKSADSDIKDSYIRGKKQN